MSDLCVGFAQIEITPDAPGEVYQDGYGFRLTPAEGVRDPLYAKVCLLQTGTEEYALVSLDICGLDDGVRQILCDWITVLTGLPVERLALCATHTHAGPACGVLAGLPRNGLYWNRVGQRVARAVQTARDRLTPGAFRCAWGDEFALPLNRRGRTEIDRRVPVWAFYDADDALRGALVSASCHAVCDMDMRLSADYPGVLTSRAIERFGPDVPFVFLQGRGADINPHGGGEEALVQMGEALTACVWAGLDRAAGAEKLAGPVKGAFTVAAIPFRRCDPAALAAARPALLRELAAAGEDAGARRHIEVELLWNLAREREAAAGKPVIRETVLQLWRVGADGAIAFVPFEMLTVTGNAVEEMLASHGVCADRCLVVGYANGVHGYLCPAAEADQEGYETGGAAHWYGLPECTAETEPAVLRGLAALADGLFA